MKPRISMITLGVNDLENQSNSTMKGWAFPIWKHLLKLPSTHFSG